MLSTFSFLKQCRKTAFSFISTIALLLPFTVFAAADFPIIAPNPNLDISVVNILNAIFNILWPIVVAIVILSFIYAGILFVTAHGDPTKISKGKSAVLWGIAGIVVIILSVSAITIVGTFLPVP